MHCLNLKITYNCNNKCSYCFSSNLKNNEIELDGLLKTVENGFSKGCRMLILSGGEPTLYPERIIKIITLAKSLGYKKFTIQTNGFGIKGDLAKFLNDTENISISFSVLGACDSTHDKITQRKGSFNDIISAINLIYKECEIITNTVISKKNINELDQIVNLILPFSPNIMQFSIMHTEYDENYVGLIDSIKAIKKLIDNSNIGLNMLRTEGITACLMNGFEQCIGENYWPKKLDICNDNYNISRLNQLNSNMRFKSNFCKKCIFDEICYGVWIETKDEFLKHVKKGIN